MSFITTVMTHQDFGACLLGMAFITKQLVLENSINGGVMNSHNRMV